MSRIVRHGRAPYVLSAALGVVATASAALTVAYPAALSGVAAANGNLRGTAIVVLVVGIPLLAAAVANARRGSARAYVVWVGTLGYLLYQAALFCFSTPFNRFFLLYVAYLGLAVWSVVLLARRTDLDAFRSRLSSAAPIAFIAICALVLGGLNASAWLAAIIPAVMSDHPRAFLSETGLTTNTVYIQDLGIWLPLLAAAAIASLRGRIWGELITGGMLVMFVLESISISVDQWFGATADPNSSMSSVSMVPAFAVVAAVTAVPVVFFLRSIDRSSAPPGRPGFGRRSRPAPSQ